MWTITAAPLILGNDVRTMSAATREMVANPEAIAIDQDPLGIQGIRFGHQGRVQFWVKPLANGDRAVALLNRGLRRERVRTSLAGAGLHPSSPYDVRDVWAGHSFEGSGRLAAVLRPHEALLYRFSPRR
jgi:alpha-galactosidase